MFRDVEGVDAVDELSHSQTTQAHDKKLVYVCLFINKSSLSFSFRLV